MLLTEEIERAVVARSANRLKSSASPVEQGMCTLRHDGLRKAATGITSLEEILRVVK